MVTVPQLTMMGQSYNSSIEGLNHIVPKWNNRSSKVSHLVFLLDQWCVIYSGLSITLSANVLPANYFLL